jgi:NAD(P)-dependent dehydrogenase (short-subunit alcohol dehydrogenase family)
VTVLSRTQKEIDTVAAGLGSAAQALEADVTHAEEMRRVFEQAAASFGPIDILVNNAGQARSGLLHKAADELWHQMLAVNLNGTYHGIRAALPAMLERGFGRIVNIASTSGLRGYPYVAAYCAAKHGVIGLTRALALEVAQRGVTVNAVCPGFTDTALVEDAIANIRKVTGRSAEAAREALTRTNPQGRLIEPAEVAHTVAWLCLPGSESVTGQSIAVAGGEVM